MILYESNFIFLISSLNEKISDKELKTIHKKNGDNTFRICFLILSVIMITVIPYSWIVNKEFPLFYILFFYFLCLPMTIDSFKSKEEYACYGIVKDKTIRCARITSRSTPAFMSFDNTVEKGTYKHKLTLSSSVCDYYFCSVEINGTVYDNICCNDKDFKAINEGDKVIVYLYKLYSTPVVYACSGSI